MISSVCFVNRKIATPCRKSPKQLLCVTQKVFFLGVAPEISGEGVGVGANTVTDFFKFRSVEDGLEASEMSTAAVWPKERLHMEIWV